MHNKSDQANFLVVYTDQHRRDDIVSILKRARWPRPGVPEGLQLEV